MGYLGEYFILNSIKRLNLSEAVTRHIKAMLKLTETDNRINVARIHEALFPLSTKASANSGLSRLLNTINETAKKKGISLTAHITADKKAGAANRWVWFEGTLASTEPAYTGDLKAIPPELIFSDQQGLLLEDHPVVVLITFNEHETVAVLQEFYPGETPQPHTPNGITYNKLGLHGGMNIFHCVSKQGPAEAQAITHDIIEDLHPKAVIAVGIAFGVNPEKQNIGDVLVSETIQGYDLSRINSDGSITPRDSKPPSSHILFQRFNHLDQTCKADLNACLNWPRLHFGTLLSGSKLLDNIDYRSSLLKIASEAIGGEMEAVGIQMAADRHKMDWIIIKAICDWGDGKKNTATKEADQKTAAKNAARVVKAGLDLGNLFESKKADRTKAEQRVCRKDIDIRLINLKDLDSIPKERWITDTEGLPVSLEKDGEPSKAVAPKGINVMDTLLKWADQAQPPHLFALLGEYGMGKTITCQRFYEILRERRQKEGRSPLPLLFDLRHVTGLDKHVPTLEQTLEECMERGWLNSGGQGKHSLEEIFKSMEQGAMVIIDGLDEVLVKLKEAEGQIFTNNLLKLKADIDAQQKTKGLNTPSLKILISCRTQYFRTLRDQKNHFTCQDRSEHQADAFSAMMMLPLNETQVIRYLNQALPGSDPMRLLETIRSVHNLEDLSRRPYTLKLVSEFIPEIEQDRMAGKTVYGVTLYRRMAQRWLERDAGKHHIRPEHKMRLAAHLAAHLWQNGNGLLPAGKIEDWFHAWLESEPTLRRRYSGLHPDQLEEDLRTATFLTREDNDGGSAFKFAHTSLLEFFLADYLADALRENDPLRWAIKTPSHETLDFLGQILAEAKEVALLHTLQQWIGQYRPQASELILAYSLHAHGTGRFFPSLRGMVMAGADLQGRLFGKNPDTSGNRLLDLTGADFTGANLRQTLFNHVCLDNCTFKGAQLAHANFLNCNARETNWQESECTAAIWRTCNLEKGNWQGSNGYSPQFLFGNDVPDAVSGSVFNKAVMAPEKNPVFPTPPELIFHGMHLEPITAASWSPDGLHIVSASWDNTLRVWDAGNAREILRIEGHSGPVTTASWSPDGLRIVSASYDNTLRVWDAGNAREIFRIEGHSGPVTAASWSPDGTRILSASWDNTLRVWDAGNAREILRIEGCSSRVTAASWSPDGTRIVSASYDNTLRVWDAGNAREILKLEGHSDKLTAASWSPDGTRILSASLDTTLRVWDTCNAREILMIEGHSGGANAASWSPDGLRILSASDDRTLRVWDAGNAREILKIEGYSSRVTAASWSPDGLRILSASWYTTLCVWDAGNAREILRIEDHPGTVTAASWSPDGIRILSASSDNTLRVWEAGNGREILKIEGHSGPVTAASWSPDGLRILSASSDKTLRVWEAGNGREILKIEGHSGRVTSASWSPDGLRILSSGSWWDNTLRVWDAGNAKEILRIERHSDIVTAASWSPDGTRILSSSSWRDKPLRVWDAGNGREILRIKWHSGRITAASWSPDGLRILSASVDKTIRVWEAGNGREILKIEGHSGPVTAASWSPDGLRILSASSDKTLRVWEAGNGREILKIEGHSGRVIAASWSPDGLRILSTSSDRTLRVWEAGNGCLLRVHAMGKPSYRYKWDLEPGYVVWEPGSNRIIEACGEIWRDLSWVTRDAQGRPEFFPVEIFGPLPAPKGQALQG